MVDIVLFKFRWRHCGHTESMTLKVEIIDKKITKHVIDHCNENHCNENLMDWDDKEYVDKSDNEANDYVNPYTIYDE